MFTFSFRFVTAVSAVINMTTRELFVCEKQATVKLIKDVKSIKEIAQILTIGSIKYKKSFYVLIYQYW